MSAIESAPATMPATNADTFPPAAIPGPPDTVDLPHRKLADIAADIADTGLFPFPVGRHR